MRFWGSGGFAIRPSLMLNMMYHQNGRNEDTDPTPNPSPTREGSAYGFQCGRQGGSRSPPL